MDKQVFAEPDGSLTAELNSGPVRAKNASGEWADIDTDLVERGGRLVPKNVPGDVTLSAGGDRVFAQVDPDGQGTPADLAWRWPTVLPEPVIDGPTATYPDAVPGGGDLVVIATSTGFTHNVVLHDQPAKGAAPLEFTVPVTTPGAEIREASGGVLEIKDASSGTKLAAAPAPVMWDSSGTEDTDPVVAPVNTSVVDTAAGGQIVLKPDMDFLTDPDTEYPVTVDPTFSLYTIADTWVDSGSNQNTQSTSGELRVGTTNGGTTKARSFLKFNGDDSWRGKAINSATLTLRNFASGNCTASSIQAARIFEKPWSTLTLTWDNQPLATTNNQSYYAPAAGADGCPSANATWGVTAMTQAWADGYPNYGIRLQAVNEASNNTYRRYRSAEYTDYDGNFRPKLTVNYETKPPSAPSQLAVTPSRGSATSSSTPTLSARVVDVDSPVVDATFRLYDQEGTVVDQQERSNVASGAIVSVRVPHELLDVGTDYSFDVVARDESHSSPPSARKSLTYQPTLTTTPAPPCNSPCTPIAPEILLDASIPGGGSVSSRVALAGIEPGTIDRVQIQAEVTQWTEPGALTISDPDFDGSEPPTIEYGANSSSPPLTGTAEVFPSYDDDQILVTNGGTAAVKVVIRITGWVPVVDPDSADLEAAEEYEDDVEAEAIAEDLDSDTFQSLVSSVSVRDNSKRQTVVAAAPPAVDPPAESATTTSEVACPENGDPGATCYSQTTYSAPTAEDMAALADIEEEEKDSSSAFAANGAQAAAVPDSGCPWTQLGLTTDWVNRNRYSACVQHSALTIFYDVYTSGLVIPRGAVSTMSQVVVRTDWDSRRVREFYREVRIDGWGRGKYVANQHRFECLANCGSAVVPYDETGALNPTRRVTPWHNVSWTADVSRGQVEYMPLRVTAMICSLDMPTCARGRVTVDTPPDLIRCDDVSYVRVKEAGCVNRYFIPTWTVSLSGPFPQAAAHIKFAQAKLAGHPGRRGANGLGVALKRKYWNKKKNLNRREALRRCRGIPQDEWLGNSCDEYPMAATEQGCYYMDCKVRKIDGRDNSLAGSRLHNQLFRPKRVLNGDPFWVSVVP